MHVLSKAIATLLAGTLIVHAQEPGSLQRRMTTSFADLSIEELMNESVSSVSKRDTTLSESPAAVAVVTQDDIRRLGITSLPEALRWVPGLQVARVSGSEWAISSRGFNNQFSNKLLVVMDGRTIYNPGFGGVFWGAQDTAMEDIERIEVIRGPGATLWGANAVNGVINIITKSAKYTQGTFVSGTTGNVERAGGTIRHGGQIGDNAYYRVYLKYFNRDGLVDEQGRGTPDQWDAVRSGFRLDWEPNEQDTITFQGAYYYQHAGERLENALFVAPFSESVNERYLNRGGNMIGRWTRKFSETSQLSLQSYYDHSEHGALGSRSKRDTGDIELQHRFALGSRHDVILGVGYRYTTDDFTATPQVSFTPSAQTEQLFTAFAQDQIALVPKKLSLILGTKIEHNHYTGLELQPGARVLWTPNAQNTVWASASRAVRTPTRLDSDIQYNLRASQASPRSPVVLQTVRGAPGLASEEVMAYELGYRVEPTPAVSVDVALFYNQYDNIISYAPGVPVFRADAFTPHVEVPLVTGNNLSGDTYGAELAVQWKVTDRWRIAADYSWLQMHLRPASTVAGESPQQQVRLRSYVQLPWDVEFNSAFAFVDELPSQNIPSYLRVDLGLVWRPTPSLEVGLWGQNLLDDRHTEFANATGNKGTEIPRSVLFKVTWNF